MRKTFSAIIAAIALAGTVAASGFRNPVIRGFYPDPSVCRVDSDYYLVNSSFQFFPGVPLWHSRDLVNWHQLGNVLDRPEQLPLKGTNAWLGIYAPTLRHHNGVFYMITTNVGNAQKGNGNFFVTATDPRGPWSEPVWLEQGGIDPSLFFEDGKCYMVSNPDEGIWMCEIDPATGKQLTESKFLWQGTGGRHPEAPHIYKRNGWYYLMLAEGGTEMGHMVTIARSRNIYGPYESNPSNPILTHFCRQAQSNPIQGTGHADLVEAHDGSWWLVCLGFRTQANSQHLLGRETFLAPVEWTEQGWPVVNGNGTISLQMDVATLPLNTAEPESPTVDFRAIETLGPEWVWIRNPYMENYNLSPQGLALHGTSQGLCTPDSPTWVGRRQQDIDMEAITTLQLTDTTAGAEAGLCVYMDNDSHYEAFLCRDSTGTPCIGLRYRLKALSHTPVCMPLPSNETALKVRGSDDMYAFSYSTDNGATWHLLGELNARYLSTETAGGFTGITLGLYATNPDATPRQAESRCATAIFTGFTYTPLLHMAE